MFHECQIIGNSRNRLLISSFRNYISAKILCFSTVGTLSTKITLPKNEHSPRQSMVWKTILSFRVPQPFFQLQCLLVPPPSWHSWHLSRPGVSSMEWIWTLKFAKSLPPYIFQFNFYLVVPLCEKDQTKNPGIFRLKTSSRIPGLRKVAWQLSIFHFRSMPRTSATNRSKRV